MPKVITLEKIEKEIELLTPEEKLILTKKLACSLLLSDRPLRKELNWKKLYGLGKGLWEEDAQKYVERLREERL